MISEKQQSEYKESGLNLCPHCGGNDLDTSHAEVQEDGYVLVPVKCCTCEKEWIEAYKFSHLED
jgi:predicted Zn-ribbon and HTH transcriptional regulator